VISSENPIGRSIPRASARFSGAQEGLMRLTQPGLIACFAMVTVGLSSCGGETDADFPETGGGAGGARPTGSLSGGSGGARAGSSGTGARGGSLGFAGADAGGASQVEHGGMAGAPAEPRPPGGGAPDPGVGGSGGAKAEPAPGEAGAPAKTGEGGARAKADPPAMGGAGGKADPPAMGGEGGKAEPPRPAEGGAGGGEEQVVCPDEQPEAGSECEGKGACEYDIEACHCEPKGTWACTEAPE
jgi:hypothetical protein